MKKILRIILPMLILGAAVCAFIAQPVSALTLQEGAEAARCDGCPENLFGNSGVFKQITNTILYIVGVVAVIMLIIGGVKYVISGGDSKKVTDAKNTVLYAIIGLVIAFLAFAIVNFVVSALPSSDNRATTSDSSKTQNKSDSNDSSSNSGDSNSSNNGENSNSGQESLPATGS